MEDKVNTSNNNNSFSIKKIGKNIDGVSFDIRQHSLYELVCISKGNIKLTIDFQTYDLKENTVYLIKPGQVHQWIKDEATNTCIVLLSICSILRFTISETRKPIP